MTSIFLFYLAIKAMFLYGLVRAYVVFEPLQKHWLFLGLLYTAGVGFISFIFFVGTEVMTIQQWKVWLPKTCGLAVAYFWLLRRFDEGFLFWVLLLAGLGLVWF